MGVTKGIVSGGNYSFNAAARTITFSSDYLGMSLSDITYITNIKSGVATVIYDPFDITKGGILNGLVLTLAFNTTSMSNADPLQIIVGFTPSTADPTPVKIVEGPDEKDDTALLQNISDNLDYLNLSLDQGEGIQVNTREVNPARRDANNAQVISDGVQSFFVLGSLNASAIVDTSGYQSIEFYCTANNASNITLVPEISPDGSRWDGIPYVEGSQTNILTSPSSGYTIGVNSVRKFTLPATTKFARVRLSAYTSGAVYVIATLKLTPLPTGLFTQIPITGSVSVSSTVASLSSTGSLSFQAGGLVAGGGSAPGSSTLFYPVINGGREAPYTGFLAGITRSLLTDSQGRYILGGDYDATRPRDPISGLAQGPYGNAPVRGVGGIQNNNQGAQSLTVADVSQVEGDTNTMLLKQILQELKILNQQITELPMIVNTPSYKMSEPQEYRDDNSILF